MPDLHTTWVLNTLIAVELGRDRHSFSVNSVTVMLITAQLSLSASGSRVVPGSKRGMVFRFSVAGESAAASSGLCLMTTPQIKVFSCVRFTTAVMAWELTTAGFTEKKRNSATATSSIIWSIQFSDVCIHEWTHTLIKRERERERKLNKTHQLKQGAIH